MMNSTAHSGPTFDGMLNTLVSGRPFLQQWREATGHKVNITKNLAINVLECSAIPPNCIVLQGTYQTVYLIMGIQLNSQQRSILQTWQDTGKGTWKLITSGGRKDLCLTLRWPTLAENSGATD